MYIVERVVYILWMAAAAIIAIGAGRWLIESLRHDEDTLRVVLDPNAAEPTRAFVSDAGLDLYSPVDIWVPHTGVTFIDTGVHVEIDDGCMGEIRGRSGLSKRGIMAAVGTIDPDYRGSIGVVLFNVSGEDYHIHEGDRIAQLVITPVCRPKVEIVDVLTDTDRAGGGFGSTGT